MSLFHLRKLVAGALGSAGWRPWGLSNLIMAIFSDAGSLTSGLSFCEVPGGRQVGYGGWSWIELVPWRRGSGGRVSSALRWGEGVLTSNQGSSFHPIKDRDVFAPFTCILVPSTEPEHRLSWYLSRVCQGSVSE